MNEKLYDLCEVAKMFTAIFLQSFDPLTGSEF
jgi:hypothetical protein